MIKSFIYLKSIVRGNNAYLFFFISFLLGIVTNPAYAQQENVWAFGVNAGVDFNSGTPVPIQSALNNGNTPYGSVCDASGQLLFYTNGDTAYNKNGQIMPNGGGLTGISDNMAGTHNGPTGYVYMGQGVIIVPMPGSDSKYYIFSITSDAFSSYVGGTDTSLFERLYYSVIDMNLNGGLGDVEQGKKSILLDTNAIADLTAVTGSDCNVWLLFRSLPNLQFKAYNISAAGIDPNPVVSGGMSTNTFSSYNFPMSYLAVAPNHQKLASAIGMLHLSPLPFCYLQLFDFDSATGIVSANGITIDYADNFNDFVESICFSPDNSKLYSSGRFTFDINQFDISPGSDSVSILNSATYLGNEPQTDLKQAPDGKIYFIADDTDLGAIESPNSTGTACLYNPSVLRALSGTSFGHSFNNSLPNIVPIIKKDTMFANIDTIIISGGTITAPSGYSSYQWNDSTTNAQKSITTAGTYWVAYYNYYCQQHLDTFHVSLDNTGVPKIANNSLDVYPNPAQSEIIVTINGTTQIAGDIQIVNVLGQVVLQESCNKNKQAINISNLKAGTYIISYISKGADIPALRQHILIYK